MSSSGGVPSLKNILGGRFNQGFDGCISNLKIGSHKIAKLDDFALTGVNVRPCDR